jgi:hypothetical protein
METENGPGLGHKAKEYIDLQLRIIRLEAADKVSAVAASVLGGAFLLIILFAAVLFVGVAAALLLSKLLESYVAGFSIIAGLFFVKLLILFVWRKFWLFDPIHNFVLRSILKEDK